MNTDSLMQREDRLHTSETNTGLRTESILCGLRPAVGFTNLLQPAPSELVTPMQGKTVTFRQTPLTARQPTAQPTITLLQTPLSVMQRQARIPDPADSPERKAQAVSLLRPAAGFSNPLRPARSLTAARPSAQSLRSLPLTGEQRSPAFTAPGPELLLR